MLMYARENKWKMQKLVQTTHYGQSHGKSVDSQETLRFVNLREKIRKLLEIA